MINPNQPASRRQMLSTILTVSAGAIVAPKILGSSKADAAITPVMPGKIVRPALFEQAMAALNRHGTHVGQRDRIGIVDFSAASAAPRLHIVDLIGGRTATFHVAHGSGSDPLHSGWLQHFSNAPGSNASSEGAFLTADYYVGKHGRSQRLIGLDATNNNALPRALVIHSAWYANEDMIATHGMLGRSQGCFAVGEGHLEHVFGLLGPERLIYAAKI